VRKLFWIWLLCAFGSGVLLGFTDARSEVTVADRAAFTQVCGACHPASAVNGFRTAAEWRDTVEHMISIGAKGKDEQFDAVMRVLERTLTKVNVNAATAEEIAPVLDIDEKTAAGIVTYRGVHGKFKTIEDLKKAPGLDAAKVDGRKERIVF
jgi:competence protein ComEA